MLQFFKNNTSSQSKDGAPTIDNSNALGSFIKEPLDAAPQEQSRLEIRIIQTTDQFQEIEIICGKKKKRLKITKFLPNYLTNDYLYHPMAKDVGATHLKSLKQESATLLLKEKLLNVLAKINLLHQDSQNRSTLSIHQNGRISAAEINFQRIWDGPQRMEIDKKFLELSVQQKQEMFDKESARRSPYLSTPEKAILVAAINHFRPIDNKVERNIVSRSFGEISDQTTFKEFVKEVVGLIADKEKLIQNFFVNKAPNSSPDKHSNLIKQVTEIFSERDESKRKHKIRALKKFVDQQSASVMSK